MGNKEGKRKGISGDKIKPRRFNPERGRKLGERVGESYNNRKRISHISEFEGERLNGMIGPSMNVMKFCIICLL